MDYINFIIISCIIVTFIPRLLSVFLVDKFNSPKIDKFLNLIPFTALSALIFPGVLSVDSQMPYIGLIGAFVAGAMAWKKVPLGAIVILTVLMLIMVYSIVLSI